MAKDVLYRRMVISRVTDSYLNGFELSLLNFSVCFTWYYCVMNARIPHPKSSPASFQVALTEWKPTSFAYTVRD